MRPYNRQEWSVVKSAHVLVVREGRLCKERSEECWVSRDVVIEMAFYYFHKGDKK
jgi:hypothetical protein